MQTLFMLLLGGMAIFLILLVLVQRGRGGGLAGALGGMGGSSAFGAKAGDVFTRITIGTATIWIILCIAAAKSTPSNESRLDFDAPASSSQTISSATDEEGETAAEGETTTAEQPQTDAADTTEPAGESTAEPAADSDPESSEEAK